VTDARKFFQQVYRILKPAGTFLIAEPKMHVTQARFDAILPFAAEAGFHITAAPSIRLSRSVVCKK
jgi:ubiquinone/menaquinone biosynthesis C-methylase UbiE